MIIYGIQMKAITKYIATLFYILLYLSLYTKNSNIKYFVDNSLAILYGPIWAMAICGLIINNFYHDEIRKRDNTTTIVRIISDVFGHILPLILITLYAPQKSNIPFIYYLTIIILFFYISIDYLLDTYIGVPTVLITLVAPAICLGMYYLKYIS